MHVGLRAGGGGDGWGSVLCSGEAWVFRAERGGLSRKQKASGPGPDMSLCVSVLPSLAMGA